MELRKFVLLKNNMIYDLVVERDIEKFNMVRNGNQNVYGVKNTSDNIFDLVEVGDLIGYKITPNSMLEIAGVKEEIAMVTILKTSRPNCFGTNNGDVRHAETLSIYKRQPNGDYKKYEVK